jgi:hypothetical protein
MQYIGSEAFIYEAIVIFCSSNVCEELIFPRYVEQKHSLQNPTWLNKENLWHPLSNPAKRNSVQNLSGAKLETYINLQSKLKLIILTSSDLT